MRKGSVVKVLASHLGQGRPKASPEPQLLTGNVPVSEIMGFLLKNIFETPPDPIENCEAMHT